MKKNSWLILISLSFILILALASCATKPSLPKGDQTEWTLVVIGDSSLWEFGEAYARLIEEKEGVKVILEDYANQAGSAGEVLQVLETGKSFNLKLEKLPQVLRDAEIVVIFLNPENSVNPEAPLEIDGCFSGKTPGDCSPQTWSNYAADMEAIWKHIIALRDGQPTVLYATDLYNPLISIWNEEGIYQACDVCWQNLSDANRQVAETLGIHFFSRYDLFNGDDHQEDPRQKGYIREDGEHPTELGAQVTAEKLYSMGLKPVESK